MSQPFGPDRWLPEIHVAFSDFLEEAWKDAADRAEAIRRSADDRAPKLTGEGAASIAVSGGTDDEGRYIEVGTDVDHMFYQEFGTFDDPPQPFMRPAIEENVS